jgi:hypothetical protein
MRISLGWERKMAGKPEKAVVAPTVAEYLRNVLRFIFFIKNPSFR